MPKNIQNIFALYSDHDFSALFIQQLFCENSVQLPSSIHFDSMDCDYSEQ